MKFFSDFNNLIGFRKKHLEPLKKVLSPYLLNNPLKKGVQNERITLIPKKPKRIEIKKSGSVMSCALQKDIFWLFFGQKNFGKIF